VHEVMILNVPHLRRNVIVSRFFGNVLYSLW